LYSEFFFFVFVFSALFSLPPIYFAVPYNHDVQMSIQYYAFLLFSYLAVGGTVNGQTTDITVTRPRLASQPWAYCTLEMYEIATCDWMPPSGSSCAFTELQVLEYIMRVPRGGRLRC
jgi:hypothetical protein